MQAVNGLLNFADSSQSKAQSLFQSEGYFWLATATAVCFAAERLEDEKNSGHSKEVLLLFNHCIRQNCIKEAEIKQAKLWAKSALRQINRYNSERVVFQPEHGIKLCQCFTTYWLFFKLIELEWQEMLAADEIAETYQFMDTVLADGEELEKMEETILSGGILDDDSKIYLRSRWRQVRGFWYDLEQDLLLLSQGFVSYQLLH